MFFDEDAFNSQPSSTPNAPSKRFTSSSRTTTLPQALVV
jgi:hypothetical protein